MHKSVKKKTFYSIGHSTFHAVCGILFLFVINVLVPIITWSQRKSSRRSREAVDEGGGSEGGGGRVSEREKWLITTSMEDYLHGINVDNCSFFFIFIRSTFKDQHFPDIVF